MRPSAPMPSSSPTSTPTTSRKAGSAPPPRRGPGSRSWTNDVVAAQLGGVGVAVHAVGDGDAFTAAGFDVQVHGRDHGVIHPDVPVVRNIGFLVDGALFHPGDAFTLPAGSTPSALLLPVHAPWLRLAEAVDYTREVRPSLAFAAHEAMLNDLGLALIDRMLGSVLDIGAEYRRLRPGEAVDIP